MIDLLGRLRGGGADDPRTDRRRAELLDRFDLDPTKKGRTYSKGNRQKVALVAALASDAELLILDEPTSGLDPLMEQVFRDCIREVRAEGRTVLLSSHILSEVENLCERLTIIRSGRTVQTGSLADMRHLSRTTVDAELSRAPVGLESAPGVHDLRTDDRHVHLTVEPEHLGEVMNLLAQCGIRRLTSAPPSLEELFMNLYRSPVDPEQTVGARP